MPDIPPEILTYILIGFFAQLIDGALGMAFGVISSTFLLAAGHAPAVVSASVHSAEMVVTAFSSSSHIYFKNVNWKLCLPLSIFGAIGGVAGATLLANIDGDIIKPYISGYLALLGLFILWKAATHAKRSTLQQPSLPLVSVLGTAGGMLDACGGGGWGPIVTSNLLARGNEPRRVIGSVNTSEFIVTTAITLSFIATLGFHFTPVVVGLLIGGIAAAPLGAVLVRKLPARAILFAVGTLITCLSTWQLVKIFAS